MKKIIAFAAAAAVMLSTAASAAGFGKTAVLGDSIATGYGLDGYTAGDNYSAKGSFGNMLSAECSDYVNLAVDGRTTAQLLEALDTAEMRDAVADADCVIISIGGNDFLQPMITAVQMAMFSNPDIMSIIQGGDTADIDLNAVSEQLAQTVLAAAENVDTAKSGENLNGILAKINELSPNADVKLLTVYNPFEGGDSFYFDAVNDNFEDVQAFSLAGIFGKLGDKAEAKLAQLNYEIVNAANSNGAEIIDVYSAFKGHAAEYTNISSFDVHPNSSGHALIYSLISENGGSVQTSVPVKGSPATGGESAAAVIGLAAIAAAAAVLLGKKKA
ncbi:MAG: SGNH/GDSL hydrolase family protein [Oscillospiraceae bacterium]